MWPFKKEKGAVEEMSSPRINSRKTNASKGRKLSSPLVSVTQDTAAYDVSAFDFSMPGTGRDRESARGEPSSTKKIPSVSNTQPVEKKSSRNIRGVINGLSKTFRRKKSNTKKGLRGDSQNLRNTKASERRQVKGEKISMLEMFPNASARLGSMDDTEFESSAPGVVFEYENQFFTRPKSKEIPGKLKPEAAQDESQMTMVSLEAENTRAYVSPNVAPTLAKERIDVQVKYALRVKKKDADNVRQETLKRKNKKHNQSMAKFSAAADTDELESAGALPPLVESSFGKRLSINSESESNQSFKEPKKSIGQIFRKSDIYRFDSKAYVPPRPPSDSDVDSV